MASGVVAVGLFGATWIAGVVGGVGDALGNDGVARVGTVSRMLLPTDGLWRGAMHAFQDPSVLAQFGGRAVDGGFPFLSEAAAHRRLPRAGPRSGSPWCWASPAWPSSAATSNAVRPRPP